MKKITTLHSVAWQLFFTAILFFPLTTYAAQTATQYMNSFTSFFNSTIIPLVFAIAILFLFVNVVRYFIIEAGDAYARETARQYILYAVIAMVIIVSLWGIVEIIASSLGIDDQLPLCPDYVKDCQTTTGGGTGTGGGSGGFNINFDFGIEI